LVCDIGPAIAGQIADLDAPVPAKVCGWARTSYFEIERASKSPSGRSLLASTASWHKTTKLCVSRSYGEKQIGAYHIVKSNVILDGIADDGRLEELARELGVVAEYETLAK
jgi:hypothetical protein